MEYILNGFLAVATVIVSVVASSGSFLRNGSQNISCEELDYMHQQLCYITNASYWNCLKTKALSLTNNSYSCPERSYNDGLNACGYVEICAFSDKDFLCDGKYNCTSVTDGVINCTKDQLDYRVWNCTPSLLYCQGENNGSPFSANFNDVTNCIDGKLRIKEFQRDCIPQYEGPNSNHSVWYYVKFSHYDNVSAQHGILESVHDLEWTGNEAKLCPIEPEEEEVKTDVATIATVAVVIGIALVGIIYFALEGRKKLKKVMEKHQISVQNIANGILQQGTTEKASYMEPDAAYEEVCDVISVDEFVDTPLPEPEPPEYEPAPTDEPPVFNSDELTTGRPATQSENDHYKDNPTYLTKIDSRHESSNSIVNNAYCLKLVDEDPGKDPLASLSEQVDSSEVRDISDDEDQETKAFDTNVLPYIQKCINVNDPH